MLHVDLLDYRPLLRLTASFSCLCSAFYTNLSKPDLIFQYEHVDHCIVHRYMYVEIAGSHVAGVNDAACHA